jgi:hypothetical protein
MELPPILHRFPERVHKLFVLRLELHPLVEGIRGFLEPLPENKCTLVSTYINQSKNEEKKQGHRMNLQASLQATNLQQAQRGAFPEATLSPLRPQSPAHPRVL